jgi:hypothetical protein
MSSRAQRENAVLLFQFERIIRDYPPSPAEGLTSNERAVALTLFTGTSRSPHCHPSRRAVLRSLRQSASAFAVSPSGFKNSSLKISPETDPAALSPVAQGINQQGECR